MEGFFNFVALEPIRHTLGKKERLKSRKQIEMIFAEGKSCSVFPLRLLYQFAPRSPLEGFPDHNPAPFVQAGFTVSSRHFKKAVHRNRIKRLMREVYRTNKHPLATIAGNKNVQLSLFLIYVGKEIPVYQSLLNSMKLLLKKIITITSEAS